MIQHAGSITSPTISFEVPDAGFADFSGAAFAGVAALVLWEAGAGAAGFSAAVGFGGGAVVAAPVPCAQAVPANSNVDINIAVSSDLERRIPDLLGVSWSTRDDVVRMHGA